MTYNLAELYVSELALRVTRKQSQHFIKFGSLFGKSLLTMLEILVFFLRGGFFFLKHCFFIDHSVVFL